MKAISQIATAAARQLLCAKFLSEIKRKGRRPMPLPDASSGNLSFGQSPARQTINHYRVIKHFYSFADTASREPRQ